MALPRSKKDSLRDSQNQGNDASTLSTINGETTDAADAASNILVTGASNSDTSEGPANGTSARDAGARGVGRSRRIDPVAALWHGLRQPWLLLILGVLALLLIASALLFPQVPPEFAFDVPASTRWLISTASEYGAIGQVMLNLGLFDVLHSLLLRMLFGLIGLVMAVHLADVIGVLLHNQQISQLLTKETDAIDEPLMAHAPHTLYQRRLSYSLTPTAMRERVEEHLRGTFSTVRHAQFQLAPSATGAKLAGEHGHVAKHETGASGGKEQSVLAAGTEDQEQASDSSANASILQERILAQHSLLPIYLRPLLMIGLLTALIPVWLITSTGWELYPPPIAPGGDLAFDAQGLAVKYVVNQPTAGEAPSEAAAGMLSRGLFISVADAERRIVLSPISTAGENVTDNLTDIDSGVDIRLNNVDIQAHTGPPGLLIGTTDGSSDLVLTGSSQLTSTVGLIFPGTGNEKNVLLPTKRQALRIVRSDIDTGNSDAGNSTSDGSNDGSKLQVSYVVQLLDSQEIPIGDPQRVGGETSTEITFAAGGQAIRFDPAPGIVVEAQYLPGVWLMLVSLGLVLIGALGYWLKTGYVLLQLGPWPTDRTIAVAQSDLRSELAALQKVMANR